MRHCKDYKVTVTAMTCMRHDGTCRPAALRLPTPGLGSHLCGWCRCGSARKSVHPHRGLRTRGRGSLVLMASRPHWKMQPHWEPRLRFPKKCR
ncbi:unnamed protein product, partial [Staurois parvus]